MNGFLLVDKASGMTSHDVVAKARKKCGTKRVGHAGTLDPMATGVLVLGVGNATKLLQYVVDGKKCYEATIKLGIATHTDDREGEVLSTADTSGLTDEAIRTELEKFVGTILQRPSSVSAIKIDGKRAHERVRSGEIVEIPAREVTIHSIDIAAIRGSDVDIVVTCSAGTYIRAIARDLGEALGVGGHLTSLRRTLVSPFSINECADLESSEVIPTADGISRMMPTRALSSEELIEIGFGRTIASSENDGVVAALGLDGSFAALLENRDFAGKRLATPTLVAVKE
jgi:tRNA pseudouridine55 synthase